MMHNMEMQQEWIHYFFVHSAIVVDKWQTQVHIKSLENWKEKREFVRIAATALPLLFHMSNHNYILYEMGPLQESQKRLQKSCTFILIHFYPKSPHHNHQALCCFLSLSFTACSFLTESRICHVWSAKTFKWLPWCCAGVQTCTNTLGQIITYLQDQFTGQSLSGPRLLAKWHSASLL